VEQAKKIFFLIRETLEPMEGKLFDHPFLTKVEAGTYSKKQIAVLPMEEYYIVSSDLLSSKHLLSRFEDAPSQPFFESLVENEEFARSNIIKLAETLGATQSDLDAYEPDPRCQAYPSYFARLALHGSEAEVLVAFASNFSVWWTSCKRVAVALQEKYGVDKEATAFLNPFHDVPPPDAEFDDLTMEAMQRGLDDGSADEKKLVRTARLIQYYEILFWDALLELV
jgi:hypothetical protein